MGLISLFSRRADVWGRRSSDSRADVYVCQCECAHRTLGIHDASSRKLNLSTHSTPRIIARHHLAVSLLTYIHAGTENTSRLIMELLGTKQSKLRYTVH